MDNDPHSKINSEKQVLDDNARKFTCGTLDLHGLGIDTVTSFELITDWLETDEDMEKKLAYKKFDNGDVQLLLITKTTKDGKRTTEKQSISNEEYAELLTSSILRVEKIRQEFAYEQSGVMFSLKYDDFGDGKTKILEVDALTDQERSLFDADAFPDRLEEVTGDMTYYGYRVASHLE